MPTKCNDCGKHVIEARHHSRTCYRYESPTKQERLQDKITDMVLRGEPISMKMLKEACPVLEF